MHQSNAEKKKSVGSTALHADFHGASVLSKSIYEWFCWPTQRFHARRAKASAATATPTTPLFICTATAPLSAPAVEDALALECVADPVLVALGLPFVPLLDAALPEALALEEEEEEPIDASAATGDHLAAELVLASPCL